MGLPLGARDTRRGDGMRTSPLRKAGAVLRRAKDNLLNRKRASVGPDLKAVENEMKTPSKPVCFRRVKNAIWEGKDQLFSPKVLSIGPCFHGKIDPKEVEDYKVQIGAEFWSQDKPAAVRRFIEVEVFYWYPEDIQERYRPYLEYFVDMCFIDACIVLHIIDACANRKPLTTLGHETFESCITDLFLLENQLPWPLLDMMNTIKFGEEKGRENVIKFLYAAMNRRLSDSFPEVPKKLFDNALHLVGLFRGLCLMGYSNPGKYPFIGYSAQELYKKGVKITGIKPKENDGFLAGGVVFHSGFGTLDIPFLSIHNISRFRNLFLNMIAYECTPGARNNGEITTFIHVNAALLRDSDSVKIAREKFISTGFDDETIVNLFKEMSTDSFSGYEIHENTERHPFGVVCKLRAWRRELYEACFKGPYKIIFVLGAGVVLYLQRVDSVVLKGKGHP